MPKRETETSKQEQRAWVISMALVQGNEVIATVPKLEFSANWIKGLAKRHSSMCAHPTTLECQLLRRAAEYLRGVGKIKGSGVEGL